MTTPSRLLAALLGTALLASAGCHYDYTYTSVGYSYGYGCDYDYGYSYDCSPRYHNTWGWGYSSGPRYHAPCDGVRFRTRHIIGHPHHGPHIHHGR